MLIDFGEETLSKTTHIHFMCLLLRYSRFLCVYAQDHKYNSEEACKAIYRSFCRLGGRPKELVIDQDAVFVASETYGEVIKTGPLKISVLNRISGSGCVIKRIQKARDLSKTLSGS